VGRFLNSRKILIAVAVMVALVAIVVPTCRMVGCSMDAGYMGFMHSDSTAGIFGSCGGEYSTSFGPDGVIPTAMQSLLLSLIGAVALIATLYAPTLVSRPVYLVDSSPPPPPPEDPLGARFTV